MQGPAAGTHEVTRQRVEKASISAHALIVEPVVGPAFQKVRSRKKRRDQTPFTIDANLAGSVRPHIATFIALCRKHKVPRVGEWASVDEVVQVLREGYEMSEEESF